MNFTKLISRAVLGAFVLGLIAIVVSALLTGCAKKVNLNKKSDATCAACYGYMIVNCPDLMKHTTITGEGFKTTPGENLSDSGNVKTPCDSLIKSQAKGDTANKPDVTISDIKDKKTGIESKTTMNTGTGKLKTKLDIPPRVDTIYINVPCIPIVTDEDVKTYLKAKVKAKTGQFWYDWKWYIIFIGIGIIGLAILIKYLTKKN